MAAKLTRLTHKITIQLHLVTESSTTCSSRSRRPVPSLIQQEQQAVELKTERISARWQVVCRRMGNDFDAHTS